MASSVLSRSSFDVLLPRLIADYPQLNFYPGKTFCWSPANRQVVYKAAGNGRFTALSLLHEVGHGLLEHQRYGLDFELVELEVAAWEEAKRIARLYDVEVDEEHIQDCLDSYRDWLYRRSICPSCTTKALQVDGQSLYGCFNCRATWRVAPSRFCRPYRQQAERRGPLAPAVVFAATSPE